MSPSNPAATQPGGTEAQPSAGAAPPSPRRGSSRPTPTRVAELAHLDLQQLRDYRTELTQEETLVSYWRRILQARLDMLLSEADDRDAVARMRTVLGGERSAGGAQNRRTALLSTLPLGDEAPLPDLAELWRAEPDSAKETARLVERLRAAEVDLSAYRSALHARLDIAGRELIARYRDDPSSCLAALPLQRNR